MKLATLQNEAAENSAAGYKNPAIREANLSINPLCQMEISGSVDSLEMVYVPPELEADEDVSKVALEPYKPEPV